MIKLPNIISDCYIKAKINCSLNFIPKKFEKEIMEIFSLYACYNVDIFYNRVYSKHFRPILSIMISFNTDPNSIMNQIKYIELFECLKRNYNRLGLTDFKIIICDVNFDQSFND